MPGENVREHLANERTFLAWVRTSIALLGFGVVIAKLRFAIGVSASDVGPHAGVRSALLGLAFASVGVLTLVFAAVHYERTRRAIEVGDFRAASRDLFVFVAVVLLLGLASVGYLLTLIPH